MVVGNVLIVGVVSVNKEILMIKNNGKKMAYQLSGMSTKELIDAGSVIMYGVHLDQATIVLKWIIERLVLPQDINSYTDEDMKKYLEKALAKK